MSTNFWIKRHKVKKAKFWTAEFASNGVFNLKPRSIELAGAMFLSPASHFASTSGLRQDCLIIFKDSMFNINDNELMDFLADAHLVGMGSMYARLRQYEGLADPQEKHNYELTDLHYSSLGSGSTPDDIKLTFTYKHCRHYQFKT